MHIVYSKKPAKQEAHRLLVSAKVTASKVAETRVDVQLLIEACVNLGSDNLHKRELGHNSSDTLGTADQVQEQDALLGNTIVDQGLDGLDSRSSGG